MCVLFFPFAPSAASVNELSDGLLTPGKKSSPLMLKKALPSLDPPGPVADLTNFEARLHWPGQKLELVGQAAVDEVADEPARRRIGTRRVVGRAVRHRAPHDAVMRRVGPHHGLVARVAAADVRPDRAAQAQRVVLLRIVAHVREVVQLVHRQHRAGRVGRERPADCRCASAHRPSRPASPDRCPLSPRTS